MTQYATAKDIINNAAVEVGLTAVDDPFASTDKNFVQLRSLLNTAGAELLIARDWQALTKQHSITVTNPGDTGNYTLPDDFSRIIDQTAWDFTDDNPVVGPVSNVVWQRLNAEALSPQIYIIFRISNNQFQTFPQPPENGSNIKFEYISSDWVWQTGSGSDFSDSCTQSTDTPLFEGIVMQKLLKYKWLSAKGFDTAAALGEFNTMLDMYAGAEKGSPIVNLDREVRGYPLNIPDQNFNV